MTFKLIFQIQLIKIFGKDVKLYNQATLKAGADAEEREFLSFIIITESWLHLYFQRFRGDHNKVSQRLRGKIVMLHKIHEIYRCRIGQP